MVTARIAGRRAVIAPRIRLTATLLGVGVAVAVALGSAGPAWASGSAPYFTALPASGTTELQAARSDAVAAMLPNGQVLIAGPQTAELFNPATTAFTALPASGNTELQTARNWAVAARLPNGQILIAGGSATATPTYLQSAELFDPANNTFTALPATPGTELTTARSGAVAAPLPNGKVLIAGGWNGIFLRSAELFDPANNTFTALPATGNTELQTAREWAVASPLPNGQVLIAGGTNNNGGGPALASAELFDPATNTFTALPASGNTELQTPRYGAVAAPLPGGQVLIAGGVNGTIGTYLQSAELFDPASDTFTALPASGSTELQSARLWAVAAPMTNGQLLIAGGSNSSPSLQSAELVSSAPQAGVAGGDFGALAVNQPSPVSGIVVSNIGAQAMSIWGLSLGGPNAADFVITANACSGRTLAFSQSCTISVRLTPSSAGVRTATIALSDNEPSASTIPLTGTGVAGATGPAGTNGTNGTNGSTGATGVAGPTGANGATGAAGPPGTDGATGAAGPPGANGAAGTAGPPGTNGVPGATGAAGPPGPAGEVELVTCKSVTTGTGKHKQTVQKCTTKLTSSPVKFTAASADRRSSLSRAGVIYASGYTRRTRIGLQTSLVAARKLARGRYTLTLRYGRQRERETVTIG
jgi:hypothetical protein